MTKCTDISAGLAGAFNRQREPYLIESPAKQGLFRQLWRSVLTPY